MGIIDGFCVVSESYNDGIKPEELLSSMRENNIEKAVICPDNHSISVHNHNGNRYILTLVEKHPDQFIGFASVNPWYEQEAVTELEEALDHGCRGVYFNSLVQGFFIDDPLIYPLLAVCEKRKVPVSFNTGTPIQALPFQVLSLARRFSSVIFIIGHMGANDYLSDGLASAEQAKNIYLDTSLNMTCTFRSAWSKYADRMIFGSASPRSTQKFECKRIEEADIPEKEKQKILGENFLNVLEGRL
jgi:predicted TIM-barrel fold metal-dependent hydrolase